MFELNELRKWDLVDGSLRIVFLPARFHQVALFCLGPSSSPPNTKVLDLVTTSSLQVSWNALPQQSINGLLIGYRLIYKLLSTSRRRALFAKPEEIIVSPHKTSIWLKGLRSFSVYEIKVAAFTSVGDGPFSLVVGGQ